MNNIKTHFSIKDLENLSGIKAHTIRIWEKRYHLLEPERTDTNIRYYTIDSLQKLLNVSYLNDNGYKISKIAALKTDKIKSIVRKLALSNDKNNHALMTLKLAMLNFDQHLFHNTYNNLAKENSFETIFKHTFIPLLNDIGLLWQTDTITPAHEHFISSLIRQKIIFNIETVQSKSINDNSKTYVLFLPDNEVHELGLMYIHYALVSKGYNAIFLGQSVPLKSLNDVLGHYNHITFITYFTVKPEKDKIISYLEEFETNLLAQNKNQLLILGSMLQHIDSKELPKSITPYLTINDLLKKF